MDRTTPSACVAGARGLGDAWHLDEVFLTINGARHYWWRAVDQDDRVLDLLAQSRRNKQVAKKLFRKSGEGLPLA
jgi:transposase-like protein